MKKTLLYSAALAALVAVPLSCTKTDSRSDGQDEVAVEQAIGFGAYVNRSTTSKAGSPGILTTNGTGSTVSLQDEGFGVFGYYTNGEMYSETAKPDFMYNTKVYYSTGAGAWVYSPIKYWPNEFGADATSEEVDHLTFFAYAPYVGASPATGIVEGDATVGITGLSRNSATGDPYVKYFSSLYPAKCVDLCWGVAAENFSSAITATAVNNIAKGNPYIDLVKPKVSDKINFDFKHALAALNIQIDADVDDATHSHANAVDAKTKIYVRSVSFEGFALKGALNLNSPTGSPGWNDISGSGRLSQEVVTVYDGRRDGKEGIAGAEAKNETPIGLNPVIVQSVPYASTPTAGVTSTPVNLFDVSSYFADPDAPTVEETANALAASIFVIPNTENMKITIVYDVESKDDKLAGTLSDGVQHGSTIENAISKSITITGNDLQIEAGKKYSVKLHLGMTSVQFEADMEAWPTSAEAEADTDLPINASTDVSLTLGPAPVTPGTTTPLP